MNVFDNAISRWLNTIVYDEWFFQVDYWSGVHFISGFLLGKFFGKFIMSSLIALIVLVVYEVIEIVLWGAVFRREPIRNIFSDIVIGMIGFYTGRIL